MRYQHEVRGSSNHTLSSIIMTSTEKVAWSFYMVKYGSAPIESTYLHNVRTMMPQSCHRVATELPQYVHNLTMQLPHCHHKATTMITHYSHRITSLLAQSYHTSTTIFGTIYGSKFFGFFIK